MPKQKGIFKVKGTMDDVTFLKTQDGYEVERDRILKDPKFARTRENMSEFSHCAVVGKQFRKACLKLNKNAKDRRLVSRVTKMMSQIKNLDTTSVRGQRTVGNGISDPTGLDFLKGFDFNIEAPYSAVLNTQVTVNTSTGEVAMPELVSAKDIEYPEGTTGIGFTTASLLFDFLTGNHEFEKSETEVISLSLAETPISLVPSGMPTGSGVWLQLLLIEFYQELNGTNYPLNNGRFNVLNILEATIV